MSTELNKQNNPIVAEDEPLVKLSKGKISLFMSILWLLFFFDFAVRIGVNPMLPLIQKDLQLTDVQVGLVTSAVLFGMAAFVLPISYISDRFSRSKTLSVMAIIWSVCTLASGLVSSFTAFIVARAGLGVGEASYAPTALSLITSWFKKSLWGRMIGIFNTAMPAGMMVGSIFCGYMAMVVGWRTTLIFLGIPSLILGLMALMIPDYKFKGSGEGGSGEERTTVKAMVNLVVKNKSMLLLTLASGLNTMVIMAMATWQPMYMVRVMGMSVAQAGAIAGLGAALGIVAYPLAGAALDKWGKKDLRSRMWIGAMAITGNAILSYVGYSMQNIPLMLMAVFVGSFYPTASHIASQELVPVWFKAVSYGVLVFGLQFFGMFGPTVIGWFSQNFGLQSAIVNIQFVLVVAAALCLYMGQGYNKDYQRARDEEAAAHIK